MLTNFFMFLSQSKLFNDFYNKPSCGVFSINIFEQLDHFFVLFLQYLIKNMRDSVYL